MTAQVDYLVVVFTATSGASGELLGSDEKDLVQLVWQLVNVNTKTVKTPSYSLALDVVQAGNPVNRMDRETIN